MSRHITAALVICFCGSGFEALAQAGTSLRFFGTGSGDIDRVKIPIDDPATNLPGPPCDVGATDFTIEWWMRALAAQNPAPPVTCGFNINWIFGHVVFDRDRFGLDRKFGVSICGRRVVFGVSGNGTGDWTFCGTTDVLDDRWHHVVVQRRRSDGQVWIFVDGNQEVTADGPDGDISYPDDATPAAPNDPFIVLGAEKHDAGSPTYPSYSGYLDELRISTVLRYTGSFTAPVEPFVADAATAALYHFNEGLGTAIHDTSGRQGGPSHGVRRVGGPQLGPLWSTLTPFGAGPGSLTTYGAGTSGTGGFVPLVLTSGRVALGYTVALDVVDGLGGALGVVLVGATGRASIPVLGGTLLIQLPLYSFASFTLVGSPAAGIGAMPVPLAIPNDPSLNGALVNFQGFLVDGGAARGISMTNAVEILIR
jgi:hypothetical protein